MRSAVATHAVAVQLDTTCLSHLARLSEQFVHVLISQPPLDIGVQLRGYALAGA